MKENISGYTRSESITLHDLSFPTRRFGKVPLEIPFKVGSRWKKDQVTEAGLNNLSDTLISKGAIVLDAHYDPFGMAFTGAAILKEMENRGVPVNEIVVPISIKTYNDPRLHDFYDSVRDIEGFNLFVTRRMMASEEERSMFSDMAEEDRVSENRKYINKSLEILPNPGSVVFVAAYGGLNRPADKTPSGTAEILESGYPSFCTLSAKTNVIQIPYTSYMSEKPLTFNNSSSSIEMNEMIKKEHRKIVPQGLLPQGYFD